MSLPTLVAARDQRYVVHPYTELRRHEAKQPIVIESGDGIYVEDDNAHRYIEAMSGLWSVAVGFGEQRLVDAAARQLSTLPVYHTFTGNVIEERGLVVDAEAFGQAMHAGLDAMNDLPFVGGVAAPALSRESSLSPTRQRERPSPSQRVGPRSFEAANPTALSCALSATRSRSALP